MADDRPTAPTGRTPSVWAFLLALLFVAVLGAGAIALERPTGQAEGVVLADATGKPLVGATVTVTGPVTRHLLTGTDGSFRFANLPVGSYYVSAKQHRYDPQFQENTIKVVEGKAVTDLKFKLARTVPGLEITNQQRVFTPKDPVRILVRGTVAPAMDAVLYKVDLARAMALDPELKQLHHPAIDQLRRAGLVQEVKRWRQPVPREDVGDDDWFFKPVQVDGAGEGAYVIQVSATPEATPDDQKPPSKLEASYWFDVTRVALVTKRSADQLLVYGADLVSHKPLPGVNVAVFGKERRLAGGVTDANGLARLSGIAGEKAFVLGSTGPSVAVVAAGWSADRDPYRIYAYTERPVYRPGQRVYYKAVVRANQGARYGAAAGQAAIVTVKDATGGQVDKHDFALSADSTLDGQLDLAPDAPLGEYTMELQVGGAYESIRFKVADYRKPEYKVDISPDKPRYVQGSTAHVHVLSSYYFGAPVPNAKLQVTVYSAPLYGYGDPEEAFYTGYTGDDGIEPVWGFGDVVQQVEGATDAQGKYDLDVPLPAVDKAGEDTWTGDRVFTVAIEAMDASGRPVKGHQSFPVTQGLIKLGVQPDNYLYVDKKPIRLSLTTTDYDNKPATASVKLALDRLVVEKKTNKEGDDYWETRHVQAWTGSATTDARGMATVEVPPQPAGDYEVRGELKDAAGNLVQATAGAWVAAQSEPFGADAGSSSSALKVVLDQKVYKPGQTARALIVSPVPDVTALVTVEGVGLRQAQVVHLHGMTGLVSLPVTTDDEPNAYVAACVVNGKEFLEASRSLNVTPAEKFLKVSVTTDKPRYEPGDRATYTVETRDWQDHPVAADVSLGVVDQAVYAIEPDTTPDIRRFFHGPRWNEVRTSYSFAEDYSGGLDKFAPDPRVRAKFEDTAAWFPSLHTDASGRASVTVTLPDNLTTWVATVRATTADTRVGSASSTCLATKDLLVRLETPRFAVDGDHVTISAIAHSYVETPQQVQLTLALEGLTTSAPLTQLAVINPGDAKRVTWDVTVPAAGTVKARITARGQAAADAMELSFPVEAYATPQFQAFGGEADGTKPGFASFDVPGDVVPGSAKLTFQLHTSPLPAILGAIDYLHQYPYGCVEQTMSRFLPDVAIKPRLDAVGAVYGNRFAGRDAQMRDGLRRLLGMQHGDGGWGWWEHDESQVEMTAYVLYGLAEAGDAGYKAPDAAVKKAADYLQRALPRTTKDVFTRDSVRRGAGADQRAWSLFALASWNRVPTVELDRLWADRADLSTFGQAQLALTLGKLNDERRFQALELLRHSVDQSASQAHWNANAQAFAWEDNATEATAYALRALLVVAPDDPLVADVVRWLESKNARGYWDSTKDTGAAAIALADFMKVRRPPDPGQIDAVVTLNGKEVQRYGAGTTAPFDAAPTIDLPAGSLVAGQNRLELTVNGQGTLDFSGGLAYDQRADRLQPSPGHGLSVSRDYYLLPADVYAKAKGKGSLGAFYDEKVVARLGKLGDSVKSGERVLVRVSITSDRPMRYMALEDPLPAGCEILEDQPEEWGYWWDHQEYRDDRAAFFFRSLEAGTRQLYYVMRPTTPGRFRVLPTTAWAMYAPDVRARGAGGELAITE